MSSTGGVGFTSAEIDSLRASIAQLNRTGDSFRHEAQQARASERKALDMVRERDLVIRALNSTVASQAALISTLQTRLAAHLLIQDGYRRLTELYAGDKEGRA